MPFTLRNLRLISAIVLTLLTVTTLWGQSVVWRSSFNTVSPAHDRVVTSLEDTQGNVFLVTNVNGLVVVTKFDPSNNILWRVPFASKIGGEHLARTALLEASGQVLVVSDLEGGYAMKSRVFLTRIDKTTGAITMSGQADLSNGHDLVPWQAGVDAAKNIYVWTGHWSVAKFTPAGKFSWHYTYEEPVSMSHPYGFAVDSAGNSYLTGEVSRTTTNQDLVLRKIKPDGTLAWVYERNDDFYTAGQLLSVGPSNRIYLAGQLWTGSGGSTNYDWLITAFNTDTGAPIWSKRQALDVQGRHEYVASLFTDPSSGDPIVCGGNEFHGAYALKMNGSSGATRWLTHVSANGVGQDVISGVSDGNGGIVVAAEVGLPLTIGDFRTFRVGDAGTLMWSTGFSSAGLFEDWPVRSTVNTAKGTVSTAGNMFGGDWNLTDAVVQRMNLTTGAQISATSTGEVTSNIEGAQVFATTSDGGWAVLCNTYNQQHGWHQSVARFESSGALRWSTELLDHQKNSVGLPSTKIVVSKDGFVWLAGSPTDAGSKDLFVMRLDASTGAIQWQRLYDNPDNQSDEIADIVLDSRGYAVVVAGSRLFASGTDVLVWKLSTAGKTVWMQRHDWPEDVSTKLSAKAASESDVMVYGRFGANSTARPLVMRIAAQDGSLRWRVPYGGTSNQGYDIYGIAPVTNGDYLVVGQASQALNYRLLISRIRGTDGSTVWSNMLPEGSPQGMPYFDAAKNPVLVISQYLDVFIAKYSAADGNLLWKTSFDGPETNDEDIAAGVAFDTAGNVILNGASVKHLAAGDKIKAFILSLSGKTGERRWTALYPDYLTTLGAPEGISVGVDNQPVYIGSDYTFGFEGGNGNVVLTKLQQPPITRTFTGSVVLQSFGGDLTTIPLTVEIRAAGSSSALETKTVNLNADGTFSVSFDLVDGNYDLMLSSHRWLRKRVAGLAATDSLTIHFEAQRMIGGDADGDNRVTELDQQVVIAALNSVPSSANWNLYADLDGNGTVNVKDKKIVDLNLGKNGP